MLKKILALILISSMLSGCSFFTRMIKTEEIDDNPALVCKIPYDFEEPEPINMRDVKFYVITRDKMREILNGNPNDLPVVYYGLSVDGYESMSYNIQDINRYLEANKILLRSIEDYYKKDPSEENEE